MDFTGFCFDVMLLLLLLFFFFLNVLNKVVERWMECYCCELGGWDIAVLNLLLTGLDVVE